MQHNSFRMQIWLCWFWRVMDCKQCVYSFNDGGLNGGLHHPVAGAVAAATTADYTDRIWPRSECSGPAEREGTGAGDSDQHWHVYEQIVINRYLLEVNKFTIKFARAIMWMSTTTATMGNQFQMHIQFMTKYIQPHSPASPRTHTKSSLLLHLLKTIY